MDTHKPKKLSIKARVKLCRLMIKMLPEDFKQYRNHTDKQLAQGLREHDRKTAARGKL